MNRLLNVPWTLSLTSTPFTMNTLSNPKLPLSVSCPTLNTFVVTPAAISATSMGRRPTGSASTSPLPNVCLAAGDAIGEGASAVTVTASVKPASGSCASSEVTTPVLAPTPERTTVWNAGMANVT